MDPDRANMTVAAIAIACSCVYGFSHRERLSSGDRWSIGLLAGWWLTIIATYGCLHLSPRPGPWIVLLAVDCGNLLTLGAALALRRDKTFVMTWGDSSVAALSVCGVVLLCWEFLVGYLFAPQSVTPSWMAFAVAPSAVTSCVSIVGLGAAAVLRSGNAGASLLVLTVVYATMQLPAYHAFFIEPALRDALIRVHLSTADSDRVVDSLIHGEGGVKWLLVVGKVLLLPAFFSIVHPGPKFAGLKWLLGALSIALLVLSVFVRLGLVLAGK